MRPRCARRCLLPGFRRCRRTGNADSGVCPRQTVLNRWPEWSLPLEFAPAPPLKRRHPHSASEPPDTSSLGVLPAYFPGNGLGIAPPIDRRFLLLVIGNFLQEISQSATARGR